MMRRIAGLALTLPALGAGSVHADARSVAPDTLPTGFKVIAGNGSKTQSGNTLDIWQVGQRAAYSFDTHDVGSAATVNYHLNGGVALAQINDTQASVIYGKVNADGQLFLLNPHGMLFAPGAQVNVGGLLASTMSMDVDEFMKGNYRLTDPGDGAIRNEGLITAAGSVVFAAGTVENVHKIVATTVTLAAGNTVAVDLTGDGLIRARVEDPSLKASITNSGTIEATVAVTLTAGQARDTLDRVVNNSGIIRATGLAARGGEIVLEGGFVTNSGTLDASSTTGKGGTVDVLGRDVVLAQSSVIDASGTSGGTVKVLGDMTDGRVEANGTIKVTASGSAADDDGGFVETSAAKVRVADGFRVKAQSAHGHVGSWLLDPTDITIEAGSCTGDNCLSASTIAANLDGADVTVATSAAGGDDGNITVNGAIAWSANKLTFSAHRNIYIKRNLTGSGTASLQLKYGMDSANGNGADYYLQDGAKITLPAGNNFATWSGTLQEAPTTYTVVTSLGIAGDASTTTLQGMKNNVIGRYALGADIDASATRNWNGGDGFETIGYAGNEFRGRFHGLGHTITGLTIDRPDSNNMGLFGAIQQATIRNLGLVDVGITGYNQVGAFAGYSGGSTISDSYATGRVTGVGKVGGLVGYLSTYFVGSAIKNSYTAVTVSGGTAGGLAGYNDGGTIANSYATGNVFGTGSSNNRIGGLIGDNNAGGAVITDSYATGNATSGGNFDYIGGLVGYLRVGTISNSYATGVVSGSGSNILTGGLVGVVGPVGWSTISNSFWNTTTSGQSACNSGGSVYNCTGLATADMKKFATFSDVGWSIADTGGSGATWRIYEGETYPQLRSFLTSAVDAASVFGVSMSSASGTTDAQTSAAAAAAATTASIRDGGDTTSNDAGTTSASRTESTAADTEKADDGALSTRAVVIGDSRVEKPADQVVAPGRAKGRALVCRG